MKPGTAKAKRFTKLYLPGTAQSECPAPVGGSEGSVGTWHLWGGHYGSSAPGFSASWRANRVQRASEPSVSVWHFHRLVCLGTSLGLEFVNYMGKYNV